MFQGIDTTAQIILSISVGLALLIILFIVYRRGVKAGKLGFDIPGSPDCVDLRLQTNELETVIDIIFQSLQDIVELNDSKRLQRKMIFVEEKLVIIRGMKEKLFYKLLKDSGVDQDCLTSHVDAVYFVQVLNNAIYYDNGELCLKTLFRRVLKGDDYSDSKDLSPRENQVRYNNFIESFFVSSLQKWKRFFYNNYKTEIIDKNGEPLQRRISNEDIYEMDFLEDHLKYLKKIYFDIFDNAKLVDERIDREKAELFESRRNNIRKILAINPDKRGNR